MYILLNIVYIRTFVVGASMMPTLNIDYNQTGQSDIIYINRFKQACCGDIIVLDLQSNPNFKGYSVKRLIAKEGDIVNIIYNEADRRYDVVVNGEILYSKPYKFGGYETYNNFNNLLKNSNDSLNIVKDESNNVLGLRVDKNKVFVLGDNWDTSKDSSIHGCFNKDFVVGKVDIVVKPTQNELLQILRKIF